MRGVTRRRVIVAFAALAIVVGGVVGMPYVHGLSFVIRAADMQGAARRLAEADTKPVESRDIAIPTPRGPLSARVYQPAGSHRRAALLVSGLHPSGIDEPRLARLARAVAASGVAVVTPDIPELSRFEITPAVPDAIEAAAAWLADQPELSANRKVGLMGISFSGRLSLVAAGRPSIASRVASVFALGAHHDLPRVLRYLLTGSEPYPPRQLGRAPNEPFVKTPHDYGVAVILLVVAERVVPRPQVE